MIDSEAIVLPGFYEGFPLAECGHFLSHSGQIRSIAEGLAGGPRDDAPISVLSKIEGRDQAGLLIFGDVPDNCFEVLWQVFSKHVVMAEVGDYGSVPAVREVQIGKDGFPGYGLELSGTGEKLDCWFVIHDKAMTAYAQPHFADGGAERLSGFDEEIVQFVAVLKPVFDVNGTCGNSGGFPSGLPGTAISLDDLVVSSVRIAEDDHHVRAVRFWVFCVGIGDWMCSN